MTMTLATAESVMAAALRIAAGEGVAVAVAVLDGRGRLACFCRMDGARPDDGDLAIARATTAFRTGRSSGSNELAGSSTLPFVASPGGLPIIVTGRQIGSLGICGTASDTDEWIAENALIAANPEFADRSG